MVEPDSSRTNAWLTLGSHLTEQTQSNFSSVTSWTAKKIFVWSMPGLIFGHLNVLWPESGPILVLSGWEFSHGIFITI